MITKTNSCSLFPSPFLHHFQKSHNLWQTEPPPPPPTPKVFQQVTFLKANCNHDDWLIPASTLDPQKVFSKKKKLQSKQKQQKKKGKKCGGRATVRSKSACKLSNPLDFYYAYKFHDITDNWH